MRGSVPAKALIALLGFTIPLLAADPDRDFSGKWVLARSASNTRSLGPVGDALAISQSETEILCSSGAERWSYALDGRETRERFGEETRNSVAKWEGAALLINTLVSGPQNFTVMDRWQLSPDHNALTIARQIVRIDSAVEGKLVYHREGAGNSRPGWPAAGQHPAAPPSDVPPAALARRPEPGVPPDLTVRTGTRVLLELVNEISTKHAKDGDRVYLRTAVPVAVDGRVVIPRGSDVAGTVTRAKKAGRVSGKGELYIRFDSLILPNGVSRDFHARPPGDEGKVEGRGKSADPRAVMVGAGMGASIGAIARGLPGAGVGGAAGALAGVLLSRNQDVVLRPGTHVEMVLDRDLVFRPDELR
jgi:hypothetical protein